MDKVGYPDITPTFEFCPAGGHSPETRTVGVFLFGLVNERIGDDVLIDQLSSPAFQRIEDSSLRQALPVGRTPSAKSRGISVSP
jgi:hypothetical protein